jgi:hypothetical protein
MPGNPSTLIQNGTVPLNDKRTIKGFAEEAA